MNGGISGKRMEIPGTGTVPSTSGESPDATEAWGRAARPAEGIGEECRRSGRRDAALYVRRDA